MLEEGNYFGEIIAGDLQGSSELMKLIEQVVEGDPFFVENAGSVRTKGLGRIGNLRK